MDTRIPSTSSLETARTRHRRPATDTTPGRDNRGTNWPHEHEGVREGQDDEVPKEGRKWTDKHDIDTDNDANEELPQGSDKRRNRKRTRKRKRGKRQSQPAGTPAWLLPVTICESNAVNRRPGRRAKRKRRLQPPRDSERRGNTNNSS